MELDIFLMLWKKKFKIKEINIRTNKRIDKSRFGLSLYGNYKILIVLIIVILKEIHSGLIGKKEIWNI